MITRIYDYLGLVREPAYPEETHLSIESRLSTPKASRLSLSTRIMQTQEKTIWKTEKYRK